MANENSSQLAPDRLTSMLVKQPAPFLSKDQENSALITWSASGDSFIVPHPEAFARELLPTVFKHNNYTSFVRQLNIYGFRKLPAPHQEFCHPCFKRGQPQLLSQIHRGGMTHVTSQADGPAAEISSLKGQVDKLSKALSYALAELHRRGYDTLRFDWKELVFVDPSVFLPQLLQDSAIAPNAVPKTDTNSQAVKRPAASGSMLHLQNSVEDIRSVKSENGEVPPAKVPRADGAAEASVVPMPHIQQPDMVAHSQSGFQQPPAGFQQPPQPAYAQAPMQHAIPAPSAPHNVQQMHSTAIPQPVPGPYIPMHAHEAAAEQQLSNSVPMHAVQSSAQQSAGIPPIPGAAASGGDGVPAPPTESGVLYEVPPPQVEQNQNAAPGHPIVSGSAVPPVPYQHQQQVEVAAYNGVTPIVPEVAGPPQPGMQPAAPTHGEAAAAEQAV